MELLPALLPAPRVVQLAGAGAVDDQVVTKTSIRSPSAIPDGVLSVTIVFARLLLFWLRPTKMIEALAMVAWVSQSKILNIALNTKL